MMHLHRIHVIRIGRRLNATARATVVDEFTANFKEHLNAVDQKENDNNEQQCCIATVENVCVRLAIGDQL